MHALLDLPKPKMSPMPARYLSLSISPGLVSEASRLFRVSDLTGQLGQLAGLAFEGLPQAPGDCGEATMLQWRCSQGVHARLVPPPAITSS